MIFFIGQKDVYREYSSGDRKLQMLIYNECKEAISQIANDDSGTEYLMMLVPTSDIIPKEGETEEETKTRFKRMMEATINDIAKIKGIESKEYREQIKGQLRKEGLIKESTTELELDQLQAVTARLKKHKHDIQH